MEDQRKRCYLKESRLGIIALLAGGCILSLILGACSRKTPGTSSKGSDTDPPGPVERECFVFENFHNKNIIIDYNVTDHTGDCPQEVIIPETVTTIKYGSFANKGLTSVEFSENLVEIQSEAFRDNELTEVNLPSSITTMGLGVFIYNPLTSASAIINNTSLTVKDSWWKSTNENCFNIESDNTMIAYYHYEGNVDSNPACPQIVVIPEGITTIGDSAVFNRNGVLTELHIPQSVELIRDSAFDESLDLKELHIPDGVREIGEYAFYQYSGDDSNFQLTFITIGSGIEIIDEVSFGGVSQNAIVYIKASELEGVFPSSYYPFESGVTMIFIDGVKRQP